MQIKEFIEKQNIISEQTFDCYTAIINGQIIGAFEEPKKLDILIHQDKIIAYGQNYPCNKLESKDIFIIDAEGLIVSPGLIDQHIHGGYDCDFNKSNETEIIEFLKSMPAHGITTILPTIMTDTKENIKRQIELISKIKKQNHNGAKIAGIHLEGPFLNPKYKGIHPLDTILKPSIENYKFFDHPDISMVSYAPELDERFELTKYLSQQNIIASAGHTEASTQIAKSAMANGLKQTTHTFNAMKPLHHREPGIICEALNNDEFFVEIIPDFIHIHPEMIKMMLKIKPNNKIIFVSDSLPLNRSLKENIVFGGHEITSKSGKAVSKQGTIAGSIMFLDDILKNLITMNISTFEKLIPYCSSNVALNLGLKNYGLIKENHIADIVLWNPKNNYEVNCTIIDGKILYDKK